MSFSGELGYSDLCFGVTPYDLGFTELEQRYALCAMPYAPYALRLTTKKVRVDDNRLKFF